MPVHWYYNRNALERDYGKVDHFLAPHNPHPDSVLWRSEYIPLNEKGDILREQTQYWGQRGIHYHQFLKAGENTLNYRLARELYEMILANGAYDPDTWLARYIAKMLEPRWHNDTYLEEYHRGFFKHYAQGKPPRKCAIEDEHIGGLAQVPAILAALAIVRKHLTLDELRCIVQEHVGLTHTHAGVQHAADTLTRLLYRISRGIALKHAIATEASDWISVKKLDSWLHEPDPYVIGSRFSPACYIGDAMPASLLSRLEISG